MLQVEDLRRHRMDLERIPVAWKIALTDMGLVVTLVLDHAQPTRVSDRLKPQQTVHRPLVIWTSSLEYSRAEMTPFTMKLISCGRWTFDLEIPPSGHIAESEDMIRSDRHPEPLPLIPNNLYNPPNACLE